MHEILWDEIISSVHQVRGIERHSHEQKWNEYFITNNCSFGEFVYYVFCEEKADAEQYYVSTPDQKSNDLFSVKDEKTVHEEELDQSSVLTNSKIYFFVDCLDAKYKSNNEQKRIFNSLGKWVNITANGVNNHLFLIPLIKSPEKLPEGVSSLSEREYDYYLNRKQRDYSENLYLTLENLCRDAVSCNLAKVSILRFDNVFGPGIDTSSGIFLHKVVDHAFANSQVEILSDKNEDLYSCTYIRDAVTAVSVGVKSAKAGHVYNVAGYSVSLKEIKLTIQKNFSRELGLSMKLGPQKNMMCHSLNSLKFRKIGWKPLVGIEEAIYRTVIYCRGYLYDTNRMLSVYSGRLNKIKRIELDMLKFVDQVCRENDICYFLAGGSLLGAVRHHGIIPWDDDLDIGMLRKDFEKFREICPKLIPAQYAYESPQNRSGSHYCFDKIRLKNTYFSTNYSSNFLIRDGVFLDIIVYDQTSNVELLAKLHIWLIFIWTKIINIKWLGRFRSKHFLGRIIFPVIRLLPFSFCHALFESLVRGYEKKKDAHYLIDGIGQNIRKGRFPRDWLTKIIYMPFEGMEAPIPAGYDAYLRHFYGPGYMEQLPVSQRVSGHRIARIDLGGYLYGDGSFRDADLRGELFEK